MTKTTLKAFGGRLLAGAAISAIAAGGAAAQSIDDTIVVTAQRQEQSLQDVPIAVSAFGGEDLKSRQLESFQDIQFNVPNFNFSKSQFTGSTIVLRGIGALAVGASTEPAVSVHLNDTYINAPRLFETEFFDIERLEILRGPQGTLFGRNATAGVINVITKKASVDGVEGYVDAEYGNYNSVKVQGAVNVPISSILAARLAGTIINRDGYSENVYDGTRVDDRDIYALRGSVRFLPTDNTTIDLSANYMRESDSRLRSQKQACTEGPLSPLLGCDPNGPRTFGRQDLRGGFLANTSTSTFPLVTGNPATAAYGLVSLGAPIYGQTQPTDLRQINQDTRPQYDAEETIFVLNAKHDFDHFSFKVNGNWGNSKISSRQDFDAGVGPNLNRPAVLCAPIAFGGLPAVCNLTGGPAGPALFPLSDFDVGITNSNGLVGVIGNNIQDRSANYRAVDLSIGETDYWSVEGIINSDLDGRFNFLIGANHAESNGYADYAVATTGLDYFAYTGGTLAAIGAGIPGAASTGYSFYTPYFWNDTDDSFLNSTSVFGEVYFDITSNLKLTGGVRHNWDTKGVRDRGNLLESAGTPPTGTPTLAIPAIVPLGTPSVRGLLDANELVQCPSLEVYCATGGRNDFRVVQSDFNATTGRAVLQWTPTERVQVYASWTRGYKPGGFNPRTLTALNVPLTFDPEVIKAYEAGIKSNLFSGVLQANLTGFYYDYSGLQISRIFANTSINENINATIWGIEGEFVLRPTDRLILNMNAAYLNTKAKDFSTIDSRNPTQGAANAELFSDVTNGSDCVVTRNAGSPALIGSVFGGPFAALNPLVASPFSVCSQLRANQASLNLATGGTRNYQVVDGVPVNVAGNELPGSPTFKISGGIQYTMPIGENYELTPRADAFYQNDFYSNIFNTQKDRIDGYAYVNAQVRFAPTNGPWYLRAFIQNVTNNDALTGAFDVGSGAGNFQNLFVLEPRRWGFGAGINF